MQGDQTKETETSALSALSALAVQQAEVVGKPVPTEIYTMEGLLSILWHGPPDAEDVVLMLGGAMGGTLGPADGLYADLGVVLASQGIGSLRVSYRRPNDLELCTVDALAALDLAVRQGAKRCITVGHSFGGAVAIQAAANRHRSDELPSVAGVVTLSTQAAGCEVADQLGEVGVLLIHGANDQILPYQASQLVQTLCDGEFVLMPEANHLLQPCGDQLRAKVLTWIGAQFGRRPT